MPTIGETLREARMRQRLDIADVERQTKIRAKYLRALENEEFSMLPGPTFVKTFLRTYAELLGLDPHALRGAVPRELRAARRARDAEAARPARAGAGATGAAAAPRPVDGGDCCSWRRCSSGLVVLGLSTDDEDGGGDSTTPAPPRRTGAHRAAPRPSRREQPAAAAARGRAGHAEHAHLRLRRHAARAPR